MGLRFLSLLNQSVFSLLTCPPVDSQLTCTYRLRVKNYGNKISTILLQYLSQGGFAKASGLNNYVDKVNTRYLANMSSW